MTEVTGMRYRRLLLVAMLVPAMTLGATASAHDVAA